MPSSKNKNDEDVGGGASVTLMENWSPYRGIMLEVLVFASCFL
jgi:hypothetical protein